MPGSTRRRLGLALAALITIVLAAWLGRGRLADWTHARLAARHQRQLEQLPDTDAARFIERLADADDQYLDLIVAALSDPRPAVADAAEQALQSRIQRWSQGRSSDISSRVALLARLLANSAERIPPERRPLVQDMAQRLLAWPVDGTLVDAHQLIADCETLLRLPVPPPAEIRIAARLPEETDEPAIDLQPESLPESAPPLPLLEQPLPALPIDNSPAVAFPRQPDPLEGASREKPSEPRQFIAPKAIRISDE